MVKLNLEKIKEDWFRGKKELSEREVSGIFGVLEAKKDRLLAIESILGNIKDEHCTPSVKSDIQLALSIADNYR